METANGKSDWKRRLETANGKIEALHLVECTGPVARVDSSAVTDVGGTVAHQDLKFESNADMADARRFPLQRLLDATLIV